MNFSALRVSTVFGLLAFALVGTACSSEKDHAERAFAVPVPTSGGAQCVGSCAPDPGSTVAIDCSAKLANVQLASVTHFEPVAPSTVVGTAPVFFSYFDNTPGSFLSPPATIDEYNSRALALDPSAPLATKPSVPENWGMPAVGKGGPCPAPSTSNPTPNLTSLHLYGGRFAGYGGGFGRGLPACDPAIVPASICPSAPRDDLASAAYWDLTGWTGVAFWARRGPDGQSTLTVAVQESNTADGLAGPFPGGNHCKVLPTTCGCTPGLQCLATPEPTIAEDGSVTYAPGAQTHLRCRTEDAPLATVASQLPILCGADSCTDLDRGDQVYTLNDSQTRSTCSPFTFQDGKSNSYCVGPGDPAPPEANERCGNSWAASVHIGTDWDFYLVPFSEMRQSVTGLQAPSFDTSTIASLNFGFQPGWLDLYMDDLAFYRIVP